jgi:RHS repeat-associated protein
MEKLLIEGGVPLSGTIVPAGNKNAALPLLACSLLTDEQVVLHNVPRIRDVETPNALFRQNLERIGSLLLIPTTGFLPPDDPRILGTIRAVVNEQGNVLEARDHYPYGLMMPGRTWGESRTREGYTGHELDPETGMYYAGARYYMPALARWTAVDPLAEMFTAWSPITT